MESSVQHSDRGFAAGIAGAAPRHAARAVCRMLAGAWLLAQAAIAGAAPGAGTPVDGGALGRLAEKLAPAPQPVRADFAAVALGEVLAAYEVELERLEEPGGVSRRELAKQARWGRALVAYLEGVYAARDAVDADAAVEILVAPPAPVRLLVGGQLVPLTSPRIENPGALDEAIVRHYCEVFVCEPGVLEPEPSPAPSLAAGGWSFRDGRGSTFETEDGLGFMFRDVRERVEKEQVVARVREELRRLVAVVAGAQRSGRVVDYSALTVRAAGRGDDHRVVLAPGSPGVRVFLPALVRAPGVVEVARAWVRAQVRGEAYRQMFPRADLLLAALMESPAGSR